MDSAKMLCNSFNTTMNIAELRKTVDVILTSKPYQPQGPSGQDKDQGENKVIKYQIFKVFIHIKRRNCKRN